MEYGYVLDDLGEMADTNASYKFVVAKKNGGELTFKWDKFKYITINTLLCFNNIDDDYVITLKHSQSNYMNAY